MSKMSDLHAETAPQRAETAENDVAYLKNVMGDAAKSCRGVVAILHEFGRPGIIGTDLIERLNRTIVRLEAESGMAVV